MQKQKRWYDGYFYGLFFDPMEGEKRSIIDEMVQPGKTVLDVCCGTGDLLLHLARKAPRAVGVDFSEPQVNFAQNRKKKRGLDHVEIIQGDVSRLSSLVSGPFDYVIFTLVLHELPQEMRLPLLRQAAGLGRSLVVGDYTAPQPRNLAGAANCLVELFIGGPKKFPDYLSFVRQGGTPALLEELGLPIVREKTDSSGGRHYLEALTGPGQDSL